MTTLTYNPEVAAKQTELNLKGAGLKVDGLLGPLTQAALNKYAPAAPVNPYNPPNGIVVAPATNPSNPVVSSTGPRNDINALNNDIKKLNDSGASSTQLLKDRMDALEKRRDAEISQIKSEYEAANKTQEERQTKDYAGTSTNLVTAGGGFLGYTGSQSGVLQNLKATFEGEKNALMGKRDAAIRQAQNAYEDKQFNLAQSLIKEAKDTENEIYQRQKDFAAKSLQLAQEERAQSTYERGFADDKAKAYSLLSAEEFAQLSPSQIADVDKYFFPGYAQRARDINEKLAAGKTLETDLKLKNDLQSLINKTPAGQKFTIGDNTYVGLKKPAGSSTSGLIPSTLAYQLGIPSLAGKDEGDIALSLAFEKPPIWYIEFYKESAPDLFKNLTVEQLNADWNNFRKLPDVDAYAKSAVVISRIAGAKRAAAKDDDDGLFDKE